MRIATNVAALDASRALARADAAVAGSLRRLSSGLRVGRAADDAAGLAVSEGLRAHLRGTAQAVRNAQDGTGVLRTADAALDGTHVILRRMRDLAVQAGNAGALDATALAGARAEFDRLRGELDDVADRTAAHGIPLLDGTYDRLFQVGADAGETLRVTLAVSGRAVDAAGLRLSDVDLTGGLGLAHTLTRAVAVEPLTPAPGRLTLAVDPTSTAALAALTGTVHHDGRTVDLGAVDHSGGGTAQDHLDRIAAALGTPVAVVPGGLAVTGATPGPSSLPADAAALTPRYTGPVASSVTEAVPAARNTAAAGRLRLHGDFVSPDAFATSYDALAGTVSYGGRTFDLASVDYTGATTAQQRLDRLDAAARAALATTFSPFVATGGGLYLGGETPGPASTAADAELLTPVYLGDGGTAGTLRALDRAIGWVSDLRAHVGALENRFASRVQRLGVAGENAAAAESRIRDADVAAEVAALTRGRVVAQAATAVLAQANQAPSRVLTLLR